MNHAVVQEKVLKRSQAAEKGSRGKKKGVPIKTVKNHARHKKGGGGGGGPGLGKSTFQKSREKRASDEKKTTTERERGVSSKSKEKKRAEDSVGGGGNTGKKIRSRPKKHRGEHQIEYERKRHLTRKKWGKPRPEGKFGKTCRVLLAEGGGKKKKALTEKGIGGKRGGPTKYYKNFRERRTAGPLTGRSHLPEKHPGGGKDGRWPPDGAALGCWGPKWLRTGWKKKLPP